MMFRGSITTSSHNRAFNAYCEEVDLSTGLATEAALKLRSEQTANLRSRPHSARQWVRRGRTHLQLHYPELVIGDAHKALALLPLTPIYTEKDTRTRSKAALLLCQGLFFAQCFQECLNHIQDFRTRSRNDGVTILPEYLTELRKLAKYARSCLSDSSTQEGGGSAITCGEIAVGAYPWLEEHHQKRTERVRHEMNTQLLRISDSACDIKESKVSQSTVESSFGIFARHDIDEHGVIFKERPVLVAADHLDLDCCCCCLAPMDPEKDSGPNVKGFCSVKCSKQFTTMFGHTPASTPSATRILNIVKQHMSPSCDTKQLSNLHLVARALMSIVYQRRQSGHTHPLDTSPVSHLVGAAATPRTTAFSYREDVCMPLAVLQAMGTDIFSELDLDIDVLLTIASRLELNSWEDEQEMSTPGGMFITGINTSYSLFNHSCNPNVTWTRDEASGYIVMIAKRHIKVDEELLISYLGDEQLQYDKDGRIDALAHWFGNGPHFCSRCFPKQKSKMDRGERPFTESSKRRNDDALQGSAMTKRSNKGFRSLRSQFGGGMVFQSLPDDYESGPE